MTVEMGVFLSRNYKINSVAALINFTKKYVVDFLKKEEIKVLGIAKSSNSKSRYVDFKLNDRVFKIRISDHLRKWHSHFEDNNDNYELNYVFNKNKQNFCKDLLDFEVKIENELIDMVQNIKEYY